jgi:hypothetical protein
MPPVERKVLIMTEIHTVRTGPNHALHAVLTVFTCGLWGIVWLILAVANPPKTAVAVAAPVHPMPNHVRPLGSQAWPMAGTYLCVYGDRPAERRNWDGRVWGPVL